MKPKRQLHVMEGKKRDFSLAKSIPYIKIFAPSNVLFKTKVNDICEISNKKSLHYSRDITPMRV